MIGRKNKSKKYKNKNNKGNNKKMINILTLVFNLREDQSQVKKLKVRYWIYLEKI